MAQSEWGNLEVKVLCRVFLGFPLLLLTYSLQASGIQLLTKRGTAPKTRRSPRPGCRVSIDIFYHRENFSGTKWWKDECTSHFYVDIPHDKTKAALLETSKNFERFMYRQYDTKIYKIGSDDDRADNGGRKVARK